jgi:hypothetical protein
MRVRRSQTPNKTRTIATIAGCYANLLAFDEKDEIGKQLRINDLLNIK